MPDAEHWNAEHSSIWREIITVDHVSRAITLRHPSYPYSEDWTPSNNDRLLDIAAGYLRKVAALFGLSAHILLADGHKFAPTSDILPLTWLPFPADEHDRSLARSVWINRRNPGQREPILDRTAIVLAVQSLVENNLMTVLGSRLGIRIVAHVSDDANPRVRITGATCSTDLLDKVKHLVTPSVFTPLSFFDSGFRLALKQAVGARARLDPATLAFVGVRIRRVPSDQFEFDVYMTAGPQPNRPETPSYALTVGLPSDGGFDQAQIEKFPLFSNCAAAVPGLFGQDPASEAGDFTPHPYCEWDVFEPYRQQQTNLPGLPPGDPTELTDDFGQVQVMQSWIAGRLAAPGQVNEANPEWVHLNNIPHARTNTFAAVSGYQHARKLFEKMRSYGLAPEDHFRRAALPLHVRYRAGFPPGQGKVGKTVNARVDYDPPDPDYDQPLTGQELKPLQIRFALADLKRHREPLGITTDPRWSWHEYSHVLIAASTGALELAFVHSTGDALAAILCDPESNLADPMNQKVDPSWRMATFPWVYLNRRHDRPVGRGWSWSGSRHRPARFTAASALLRKGYESEQILSTTLFRLYRALGGDTFSHPDVRGSAADYTAYLIVRAIEWLGPINWAAAETPDQFVSALTDADVATALPAAPAFGGRIGGCAYKVVRWAFETQGLYATTNPLEIVNAPGRPPAVDVFIDDRRKDYDGAHEPGSYTPVPLDWDGMPYWYATHQAVHVDANGNVRVRVRNRGSTAAQNVVVDVWYAHPNSDGTAPDWEPSTTAGSMWTHLGSRPPQTVPRGGSRLFGPISGLPAGRLFILAGASCPADLANIDPTHPQFANLATQLPCAVGPTPIVHLVAGDNNLGLRTHG